MQVEIRSGSRARAFRGGNGGGRLKQREVRKCPIPACDVRLPDGTAISRKKLHELRSAAHQMVSPREFDECAERIRKVLSTKEWRIIQHWISANLAGKGSTKRRENTLVMSLIGLTAERESTVPAIIFDRIVERRSAKGILVPWE